MVDNLNRDEMDLTPKIKTSAWYNPSYNYADISGTGVTSISDCHTTDKLNTSATTNISWLNADSERGNFYRDYKNVNYGNYNNSGYIPTVQAHQTFNRTKNTNHGSYTTPINQFPDYNATHNMMSSMGTGSIKM